MREIEYEINKRRDETDQKSAIPISNFRGIEIRDFPAGIARLALIIAEFQCDVLYCGQKTAHARFLPLAKKNWIVCGNALRLNWLSICPPAGTGVQHKAEDMFHEPRDQTEIDFENEGGETYICGNPPYLGALRQSAEQDDDLEAVFNHPTNKRTDKWKSLDYVSGWFMKAADYGKHTPTASAFVSTNSICQGQQVPILWPLIFETGHQISFAYTSFKWANLASHNAGVTVVVVGLADCSSKTRRLFSMDGEEVIIHETKNINPYLVSGRDVIVKPLTTPTDCRSEMSFGNMSNGKHLLLTYSEVRNAIQENEVNPNFIRPFVGSQEFINGIQRYCIWVTEQDYENAKQNLWLKDRFQKVAGQRTASNRRTTKNLASVPFRFGEVRQSGREVTIIVPRVSSENRQFLPCGLLNQGYIVSDSAFALYDAPLWNMALIASRSHWVWIATVCGKLKTDFRYSNTLGWNTFPVPMLTEKNKQDLTRCAEGILLAREVHFPATIADLYKPDHMPENLRHAHDRNDEVLERIYIGRRFKNDTERLQKLSDLYTKITTAPANSNGKKRP